MLSNDYTPRPPRDRKNDCAYPLHCGGFFQPVPIVSRIERGYSTTTVALPTAAGTAASFTALSVYSWFTAAAATAAITAIATTATSSSSPPPSTWPDENDIAPSGQWAMLGEQGRVAFYCESDARAVEAGALVELEHPDIVFSRGEDFMCWVVGSET